MGLRNQSNQSQEEEKIRKVPKLGINRIQQTKIDFKASIVDNYLMIWISIEEIKRDLTGYLRRVEAGETLVIVEDGKPMAEIRPVASSSPILRPFGLCAGEFVVPDDFDEPLPEDVIDEFEGK